MRVAIGTLYVLRGLPASGKSTWARRFVDAWPAGKVMRLNRDDLRSMALPTGYRVPDAVAEQAITEMQHAAVLVLLASGHDVVVDDTNLDPERMRPLLNIAAAAGARVEVVDEFLRVPVEECVRRDALRPVPVGEDVIRGMHARWLVAGCAP